MLLIVSAYFLSIGYVADGDSLGEGFHFFAIKGLSFFECTLIGAFAF
jgi:hypothetical protein